MGTAFFLESDAISQMANVKTGTASAVAFFDYTDIDWTLSITHNYGKIPTKYIIYGLNINGTAGSFSVWVYSFHVVINGKIYAEAGNGSNMSTWISETTMPTYIGTTTFSLSATITSTQFIYRVTGSYYPRFYYFQNRFTTYGWIIYG